MKIQVKDIISFAGRDYVVEGTATYHLAGKPSVLARRRRRRLFWIEAPRDEGEAVSDRLLRCARSATSRSRCRRPDHRLPRPHLRPAAGGTDTVELAGDVPERAAGPTEVWRYRAAGDLYLQIEEGGGRVFMLAGESVHRGMIDILHR